MHLARLLLFSVCFIGLCLCNAAEAREEGSRSVWLAPSYQYLLTDGLDPAARHGTGAFASYEFHISPRFNLGLNLAYRVYPGDATAHQLGYGTILRHFFSDRWSSAEGFFPFLDYGLLLQQTHMTGRRGSATSHDTRLGAGIFMRKWGVPLFFSVAGHISRLNFLDVPAVWIPYADTQLGWVYIF